MAIVRVRFRPDGSDDEPTIAAVTDLGDDSGRLVAELDLRPSAEAFAEERRVFDVEWLNETSTIVRRIRALLYLNQADGTLRLSELIDPQ